MAEDNRFLSLGIDINQSLIRRSQRGLSDLREETVRLTRTQSDSAQASRKETDALGDIDRLRKQIVRSQELRIDALKVETRQQLQLADALKESARLQNRGSAAFQEFDQYNSQIRQRAGALGDLDTALSAVGAGGAGQIFGAAEGAAQLAAAARGLPTSLAETASGLLGVEVTAGAAAAGAGVLAATLIGVEVAHKAYQRQVKESLEDYQIALDAQRLYTEAVVNGTRDSIKGQLNELEPLLEARQLEIEIVKKQRDEQTSLAGVMDRLANIDVRGPIQLLTEVIAIIDATIRQRKSLTKQLDSAQDEAQQAENSIARLNQAYNDERVIRRSSTDATKEQVSAQRNAIEVTQQQAKTQQEVAQQVSQASRELQTATQAEDARTSALKRSTVAVRQSSIAIGQLAAEGYRQQASIAADVSQQIGQVRQEGVDAAAELLRDSRLAAAELKRKLVFDVDELKRRAKFDEFELALSADFAGISAGRRQLAFDIGTAKRQSAFDLRERLVDREARTAELRLNINKQIADLEAQRLKAQQQALQETIKTLLQARGLFVPAGYLQRQIDDSVNRAVGGIFA